jgi:hypothetical protein
VALAAVVAFCTLSSVAANGGHGVSQGASSGASSLATNQPASQRQTQESLTTNTPAGPTATPTPGYAHFGDGTFQVGKDIQPGTYRTRVGASSCYWERLKGFSGAFEDIIANGNPDGPVVVTISANDKGFMSQDCGTWTQDLSQVTESKTSFDAGTYIVGTDIAPGTYKNTGDENCYWERLRDFSGAFGGIIANGNPKGAAIVTIKASDKGFQSARCGTWTKQ